MSRKTVLWALAATASAALFIVVVHVVAQTPPAKEAGSPSDIGPVNDFAEIQVNIRASDEEWKVIGPKLRAVMAAYAAVEAGIEQTSTGAAGDQPGFVPSGPGGPGGPGGPPGGPGNDSFAGPSESNSFGPGGRGPGNPMRAGRDEFGRSGTGLDFPPGPGGFPPWGGPPGAGGPRPSGAPAGIGGPPPLGGPPGFAGPGNAVIQKLMELRSALADPNATSEQLKDKMTAVREARRKARAKLAAARKDLLELLTPDQEAVLVSLDYID